MLRSEEAIPGRRVLVVLEEPGVEVEEAFETAAVTWSLVFKTSSGQTKTAVAAPAREPATAETTSGSSQCLLCRFVVVGWWRAWRSARERAVSGSVDDRGAEEGGAGRFVGRSSPLLLDVFARSGAAMPGSFCLVLLPLMSARSRDLALSRGRYSMSGKRD